MSDLPAESLGYQAVVAEYFLGLKGSGLILSPLDQELVAEWERRGLPVPVVCRGIRRGLEELGEWRAQGRADEPSPERAGGMGERRFPTRSGGEPSAPPSRLERRAPVRSLRSVRFAVEDEWRAYKSGRVGESPAPPGEEELAARRLAEARQRLAEAAAAGGPLRETYLRAERVLRVAEQRAVAVRPEPVEGRAGEHVEAALAEADARILSGWLGSLPGPERAALGARARLLAGARRPGESRRAYRKSLRAHLLDLAGQAGLIRLAGTV